MPCSFAYWVTSPQSVGPPVRKFSHTIKILDSHSQISAPFPEIKLGGQCFYNYLYLAGHLVRKGVLQIDHILEHQR